MKHDSKLFLESRVALPLRGNSIGLTVERETHVAYGLCEWMTTREEY